MSEYLISRMAASISYREQLMMDWLSMSISERAVYDDNFNVYMAERQKIKEILEDDSPES